MKDYISLFLLNIPALVYLGAGIFLFCNNHEGFGTFFFIMSIFSVKGYRPGEKNEDKI